MDPSSIVSPKSALLLLCMTAVCCFTLMVFIPEKGISMGGYTLHFKTITHFFKKDTLTKSKDIGAYLTALDSLESFSASVATGDMPVTIKREEKITSLQFKGADSSPLFPFFENLHRAKDQKIHVLHYGDSQIEGDRMTHYLREKWQHDFGGTGPGLICPVPLTASAAIDQSQSGNWQRYTAYGFNSTKASHPRYGIMAAFGRFTPQKNYNEINPAQIEEGWITLKPSARAAWHCQNFSDIRLYFGYHQYPLKIELWVNHQLYAEKEYPATDSLIEEHWLLNQTPEHLRFIFKGADSPDVQAIVLQGNEGVYVDNLALRGSDGTIFHRMVATDIQQAISNLNTSLIILQFGGNSLPYIKNEEEVLRYARLFQRQIQYLKKLAPGVSFIVVGPSDMSTTIDGILQTWPLLENVRDAMRSVSFEEGCAFWDMYAVMGGRNAMLSWVANEPPYAGTDHIHFTPMGARKMGELFYKAIKSEYDYWLQTKYPNRKAEDAIKVPGGV